MGSHLRLPRRRSNSRDPLAPPEGGLLRWTDSFFALFLHLPDIARIFSSELWNTLQGSSPIAGKVHGRTCEKHVQRFDSLLPSGTSPLVSSTPLTLRSTLSSRRTVMLRMPSKPPPLSRSLSVKAAWQRALEHGQGLSSLLERLASGNLAEGGFL